MNGCSAAPVRVPAPPPRLPHVCSASAAAEGGDAGVRAAAVLGAPAGTQGLSALAQADTSTGRRP
jgi:hypothetical protein